MSHEVFDLLQDSLSFQCLPEQRIICGDGDRPGKDTCHALKSQRKQLDTKFPSAPRLGLVSRWNQIVKPLKTVNIIV